MFSYADVCVTFVQNERLGRRPEEAAWPLLEALEGALTSTWLPIDNNVLALCKRLGISADAPPELVWGQIGVSLYQGLLQTAGSRRGRKKGSVAKRSKPGDDYFIALTEFLTGSRVVDPDYLARHMGEGDFGWLSDLVARHCYDPVDAEIILKEVVRKYEGSLPVAHRTTHLCRIRRKWRTRCK